MADEITNVKPHILNATIIQGDIRKYRLTWPTAIDALTFAAGGKSRTDVELVIVVTTDNANKYVYITIDTTAAALGLYKWSFRVTSAAVPVTYIMGDISILQDPQ